MGKLEQLDSVLVQWRCIEPVQVRIEEIQEDEQYQPRNLQLAPFKDQARLESTSQGHVEYLLNKIGEGQDLDPILIARIEGRLFVIDGHHRLQAYRKAKRESIPACVRDSTTKQAIRVSKLVNCDGVKLPMHPEQYRECAWQYIAYLTQQGRNGLPKGVSRLRISQVFNTSDDTISRMLKRVGMVRKDDFEEVACDPGTGWPQWKHVKGNAIRDRFSDAPIDTIKRHKAERLAIRLGKELEKHGEEVFNMALGMLQFDDEIERMDDDAGEEEDDWDY